MASSSGASAAGDTGEEAKLKWMYKGLTGHVDREEYLTGRKVDKTFDLIRAEETGAKSDFDVENNTIPRSILPSDRSRPLVADLESKVKEDPLSLIRKREMERRKEILLNPLRLKRLQNLLKQTISSSSSSDDDDSAPASSTSRARERGTSEHQTHGHNRGSDRSQRQDRETRQEQGSKSGSRHSYQRIDRHPHHHHTHRHRSRSHERRTSRDVSPVVPHSSSRRHEQEDRNRQDHRRRHRRSPASEDEDRGKSGRRRESRSPADSIRRIRSSDRSPHSDHKGKQEQDRRHHHRRSPDPRHPHRHEDRGVKRADNRRPKPSQEELERKRQEMLSAGQEHEKERSLRVKDYRTQEQREQEERTKGPSFVKPMLESLVDSKSQARRSQRP